MQPQEPTPQVYGPAPLPTESVTPTAITPAPTPKNKSSRLPVFVLMVVMLLGLGVLGYLYFTANQDLSKTKEELASKTEELAKERMNPTEQEAVSNFIATENDAELSRALCGGQPLGMFDVHLNDKFAVFRYLCANQDYKMPILIGALKRLPDNTYEFTYGSSTVTPNALPDYIYNSEPDFFGNTYGAQLF